MLAVGTSLHFATAKENGRYWGEADMNGSGAAVQNDVNDPFRPLVCISYCSSEASFSPYQSCRLS